MFRLLWTMTNDGRLKWTPRRFHLTVSFISTVNSARFTCFSCLRVAFTPVKAQKCNKLKQLSFLKIFLLLKFNTVVNIYMFSAYFWRNVVLKCDLHANSANKCRIVCGLISPLISWLRLLLRSADELETGKKTDLEQDRRRHKRRTRHTNYL